MTRDKFDGMNEQVQHDMARQLAETSNVLDFETALRIVQHDLPQAEKLLRMREENKKSREEFARLRKERRQALLELR
jgi:hypothetical protein